MEKPEKIVIATNNEHKINEFKAAFEKIGIKVISQSEIVDNFSVDETGSSFEENAKLKAQGLANLTKLPTIADDSGLVVPSLNGEPGIYSARYAGDHDDEANNQKLLRNLQTKSDRSAYFETALVLIVPNEQSIIAKGRVNGKILKSQRGDNGFGYDPLFYIPEFEKTMAEMTTNEKNQISHRGRAIENLMEKIANWR
ncbi:XTP/dITP diphosphatase [Lentilactobacillus laojiaonis]|uniref:XTP/dITP diphosphatase n=1 Tax=Lentilactobacillus laojiaonis TaxID=2883998 RepID=UPI001D0AA7DB|nr:XTP/dITP diphosphatase [Lentilactobacillus laojiaonis]UDM31695.1 XTP/dITP diphosphatase [Lentilactobacillus laojiaonis]